MTKTVVIGFLGTQLDYGGRGAARWQKWRPTLAACQQEGLPVHRLHLLHEHRSRGRAERVGLDIGVASPATEVWRVEINLHDPWDFEEAYTTLHDFARTYPFDTEQEDYLIPITTGTHVAPICWFLLAEARFLPARLLQMSPPRSAGAAAGAGTRTRIDLDLSRYDKIAQRFHHEQADTLVFLKSGIAPRSSTFNAMIEPLERVAGRSRAPIQLVGPTAAGKSFLARRVYELKRQRQRLSGRFVEVNCATLRGDAAMSTLFGHVRGAFTGAQRERPGLLRAADGGLLFLDEIAELCLDEQAMLLKAVEERRFVPLGSDRESGRDFQLIAGTNRDLRRCVADGRFREDLRVRINLWTFELPGLAARVEDIEPNLSSELDHHARAQGQQVRFNAEVRRLFIAFACSPQALWRGNSRELSASVTRMATLADGGRINEAEVGEEIARLRVAWSETGGEEAARQLLGDGAEALDLFNRGQLSLVIDICRRSASLSEAGRKLFAVSRRQETQANDADRLCKYLSRFGLDWHDATSSAPAQAAA